MSSAITWGAEDLSSPNRVQASNLLREEALDSRLSSLREVALTLLEAVESLRNARQPRAETKLPLHEEVQRFETELILAALVRTGGNQARAARQLGVKHTTLNAKIKRYRIPLLTYHLAADNQGDQEIAA
jgi:DNA-binding NtrC family response regulator